MAYIPVALWQNTLTEGPVVQKYSKKGSMTEMQILDNNK